MGGGGVRMSVFAIWSGPLPARHRLIAIPDDEAVDDQLGEDESAVAATAGETNATHFIAELSGAPVLAARPWPDAPPALVAGVAASWAGLPPGGTVRVIDPTISNGEVGAEAANGTGELSIQIDVAGAWRLVVDEDWPWLPGDFVVEVS